jgi:hypothetical protein
MSRSMKLRSKQSSTYLFTIRVWAERIEDEIIEWRGKVQIVSKDEGYYFRGWQDLVNLLQSLVSNNNFEDP